MPEEVMNEKKSIKVTRYAPLRQTLEPRMLYDASLMAPPGDAQVATDVAASTEAATPVENTATPVPEGPVTSPSTQKDTESSSDSIMSLGLEQFDGDIAATQSLNATVEGVLVDFVDFQPTTREIVFIDGRLSNIDALLQGISPSAEVHFLDVGQDGIEQIDNILKSQ